MCSESRLTLRAQFLSLCARACGSALTLKKLNFAHTFYVSQRQRIRRSVFWGCEAVQFGRHVEVSEKPCCIHHEEMGATGFSETSVRMSQATRCHIPKDKSSCISVCHMILKILSGDLFVSFDSHSRQRRFLSHLTLKIGTGYFCVSCDSHSRHWLFLSHVTLRVGTGHFCLM